MAYNPRTFGYPRGVNYSGDFVTLQTYTPEMFGAKADGVTDDSAAMAAAFAAANTIIDSGHGEVLPTAAGRLLLTGEYYCATGLTCVNQVAPIIGINKDTTKILVGSGQYFLTISGTAYQLNVEDITFDLTNGKGAIRQTFTGINGSFGHNITRCDFFYYSECAFGSDASDMAYINFTDCTFYGGLVSKGVVLGGTNDLSMFTRCHFLLNRYDVVLSNGGNAVKFYDCDWTPYPDGGGNPALCNIWVVPNATQTASGIGMVVDSCRFGNEFLSNNAIRVLLADAPAGSLVTAANLSTLSSGYWAGATFCNNEIDGNSSLNFGFIYSYTPHIQNFSSSDVWSSLYPYVIQFDSVVSTVDDRNSNNVIDLSRVIAGFDVVFPALSNLPDLGWIVDDFGVQTGLLNNQQNHPSGYDIGYSALGCPLLSSFTASSASAAGATDAVSGSNAATVTFSGSGGSYSGALTAATTAGRTACVEFEYKQSGSNPLTQIIVQAVNNTAGIAFRRTLNIPPASVGYQPAKFYWTPKLSGSYTLQFLPVGYSGSTNQIVISRPRVYHASEFVNPATVYKQASASVTPTAALANGSEYSTTITVTGANIGDFVMASFGATLQGCSLTASVTSANTVTVTFTNNTGGAITLGTHTCSVRTFTSIV